MSPIAKESKSTVWAKVDDAQLSQVFGILYPGIDAAAFKFTKQQVAAMVEKEAGKRTPEEIISAHATRTEKKTKAIPAEFLALSFPDGIQDVLSRLGTRVVVSEKYADTPEGHLKAVADLRARMYRISKTLTLAEAKAMSVKLKATRQASQKWDVVEFSIDDTTAVPSWAPAIVTALIALDPTGKFGKRKGAKAGLLVRLPAVSGKFNILIGLPPEYAIVTEKPAK